MGSEEIFLISAVLFKQVDCKACSQRSDIYISKSSSTIDANVLILVARPVVVSHSELPAGGLVGLRPEEVDLLPWLGELQPHRPVGEGGGDREREGGRQPGLPHRPLRGAGHTNSSS